jgi:hypothetical protein
VHPSFVLVYVAGICWRVASWLLYKIFWEVAGIFKLLLELHVTTNLRTSIWGSLLKVEVLSF